MEGDSRVTIIIGAACSLLLVIGAAVLTLGLYQRTSPPVLSAGTEPSTVATALSAAIPEAGITPTARTSQVTPSSSATPVNEADTALAESLDVQATPRAEASSAATGHAEASAPKGYPATDYAEARGVTATITPPAPTQTVAPPTETPTARPTTPLLVQQAITAETQLRTGQIEAVLDYGDGARTMLWARFDFGDAQHAARAHIRTTEESGAGKQTVERIVVGDGAWQRQPNGNWLPIRPQDEVWIGLRGLMPNVAQAENVRVSGGTDLAGLHWYEDSADADVSVVVDPATGLPHGLRRTPRASGPTLTVSYSNWNTYMDIVAP